MLNYERIIEESRTFANNHQQINSFGNGDLWETVQRDKLQAFNYPLLWMQDNGSTVQDKAIFFNFNVFVIDQVLNGEENENFVKSSTCQMLLDYLAYFDRTRLYDINGERIKYDLQRTSSLTSFTERFNDELTGWVMTVSFKTIFDYNKCNIPGIGGGVPSAPTSSISINSTLFTELACGESLDIPVKDTEGATVGSLIGDEWIVPAEDDTIQANINFIGTAQQSNIIFQAGGVTTFTSVESSADVGTITYSTDDVTFVVFTLPFTPVAGTPYYFKRSTFLVDGYYNITD